MDVNGGFPGYAYNMEWVPCDEAYCLGSGPYNSMCALF